MTDFAVTVKKYLNDFYVQKEFVTGVMAVCPSQTSVSLQSACILESSEPHSS